MPTERHDSSQEALEKTFPPTVSNGWLTRTLQILHCRNDSKAAKDRAQSFSPLGPGFLVSVITYLLTYFKDKKFLGRFSFVTQKLDICWSAAGERRGNIVVHAGSRLRLAHLGRRSWVITTVKFDELLQSFLQSKQYLTGSEQWFAHLNFW